MLQVWIGDSFDKHSIESSFSDYDRVVRFAGEVDIGELSEAVQNTGLFDELKLFILHNFFAQEDTKDWLFAYLEIITTSPHVVLMYESSVRAPVLKKLEKAGVTVKKTKPTKKASGRDHSAFAISDALLQKNRKAAWVAYQTALAAGISAEEIVGILWWQIKTLYLVAHLDLGAGVKPFVYNKAKRALRLYTKQQIEQMADDLVRWYHEARLGGPSLQTACEKFILGV